jgi:DNA-binding XRE family transcriptional regulator
MANFASALREEIARLSRREIRRATRSTKKVNSRHRHAIAALKSHVAQLERQVSALTRTVARFQQRPAATSGEGSGLPKLRFVASGLRSHRARLGLSAGDFGKLVGVSANSVYAWESGATTPRTEQLAKIAALRTIGKREAAQRLNAAASIKSAARRKR